MTLTKDEIKAIQKSGIDWLGNPLVQDGIRGPKTNWWLGITSLDPLRQEVLRLALAYHAIGMGEVKGNSIQNDGTFVDGLLKPAKLKHKPWCVAYISHCLRKVGVEWPVYHVSVYRLIEWAKANNLIITDPLPSDIEAYLYDRIPGEDWRGHARLTTGYDPTTKVSAGVDGNVGDMVSVGFRRDRPRRVFIRLPGVSNQHSGLVMPQKLMYLDNVGDR